MADRSWYVAVNGKQTGPFSDEQIRAEIVSGQVTANTLVWCAPMEGWSKASAIPGLLPSVPGAVAPLQIPVPGIVDGGQPGAPIAFQAGTWPLFGRTLLVAICQFLIIPAPWAVTAFYRWFVSQVRLPNEKVVTFEGKPTDIWWVFMLTALLGYGGFIHISVQLLLLPLMVWFYLLIMRWVFGNLAWDGQTARLTFSGRYWPMLGWLALSWVSMFSIIGWAWVYTAMLRWICRNVQGSSKQLSFVASGWDMLWRTLAFGLSCIIIIPIPWTLRWYMGWLVSQLCLSERA